MGGVERHLALRANQVRLHLRSALGDCETNYSTAVSDNIHIFFLIAKQNYITAVFSHLEKQRTDVFDSS